MELRRLHSSVLDLRIVMSGGTNSYGRGPGPGLNKLLLILLLFIELTQISLSSQQTQIHSAEKAFSSSHMSLLRKTVMGNVKLSSLKLT